MSFSYFSFLCSSSVCNYPFKHQRYLKALEVVIMQQHLCAYLSWWLYNYDATQLALLEYLQENDNRAWLDQNNINPGNILSGKM